MRYHYGLSTALLGCFTLLHIGITSATFAVTGVPNNGVQVRMELRTMQQDYPDMFNLYILGLQDFMNTNQSDPLSYYSIAGIHGRPYVPWDGVGSAPGYGGGYCNHVSNIFLPWHRPYLALYEQALHVHVQIVAQSFPAGPTRDRYVAAALDFRIPFWDWAEAPCPTCMAYPVLVDQEYLYVDTPSGQEWILNPLLRYNFNPVVVSDFVYAPFAVWNYSQRYPTNWSDDAVSQNNLVAPQIANNQVSARDRLYNLMTSYSNFSQFGTKAWISSSTQNADSLESLHDVIHAITGNNGHMTYLEYSAFDPIFWLHHAMIDRCFALWQVLYPDSYVEPMAAVGSTFTYPKGYINDVNSPLPPFHSDTQGTNWTSALVVNTTTFGYAYPETANGSSQASVMAAINSLYGNTAGSTTVSRNKRSGKIRRSLNDNVGAAAQIQSAASGNSTSYEYVANVISQQFALGSSYAIYLFMGNYSSNISDWGTDSNLVGVHGVFANFGDNSSFAAVEAMGMSDVKGTGSIPLTTTLINKIASGQLASLSPLDVVPYLTSNMDWRASYYDGTEIAIADVADLSISVVQATVEPATSSDTFPLWGDFVALVNVTANRVGGHNSEFWDCPGTCGSGIADLIYGNASSSTAPNATGLSIMPSTA